MKTLNELIFYLQSMQEQGLGEEEVMIEGSSINDFEDSIIVDPDGIDFVSDLG